MPFIKARRAGIEALRAVVCAVTVALGVYGGGLEAQVPPDEAWRTITTEHFRVTFPEGLEALGRRAAGRAEMAYESLSEAFVDPPRGRVDLLVTDHTDISNGFAQVTPSNRITIFARPPVDNLSLGFFDEWMELVITHELAHIFHLDRAGTLGKILRSVFGRSPNQWPFFPSMAAPLWTIEGLATWYESHLTQAGRVRGTFHEMVMRTAALEGRFESLDQASGDSPVWPGGNRSYTYGSMFFDYLLEKHGEERLATFADAVAGQWIPYRLNAAGNDAFGASLSDEWRAWTEETRERYEDLEVRLARLGPVTAGERITPRSRFALYPQVSPDGTTLAFAVADGRSDPQVRISALDGSQDRKLARTSTVPTLDWLPDGSILFSHVDFEGLYRTFADLSIVADDGTRRRVTEGARLTQPSAGPDGRWAVAVQEGGGTSTLVRVNLESGAVSEIVSPEPDVHWAHPSVSPDGRWIAASRWSPGAYLDVVILDLEGRELVYLSRDRAMDVAPTWSPDGGTVLWSSDRTGILNIVAVTVDPEAGTAGPIRLATNVTTGAAYPSVDPSGRWLYYSAYHVDGWEVERLPYDSAGWPTAPSLDERFLAAVELPPVDVQEQGEVEAYSPFATLRPRYWEPLYRDPVTTSAFQSEELFLRSRQLLGPAVGAQTSGRDLVGRHAYSAFARVFTDGGGKMDGGVNYSWAGLGNPVLSLGLNQRWDDDGARIARQDDEAPLDTLFVLERTRNVSAAATFFRRDWRSSLALSVSGGLSWESRELLDNDLGPATAYSLREPTTRLSDLRVSLSYSTARSHSFQMGPSEGYSLWVSGRVRQDLSVADSLAGQAGDDRSMDEVLGQLRGYVSLGGPGHASHVLAFRVSGGFADGPDAHAGFLDVGGASGTRETITGMDLFGGSSILFPVRGYPTGMRAGRTAWSATAEYRAPLGMLNRGLGAWPLHVDRIVGALYVDAGNAWGPELPIAGYNSPRRATLVSVGGEVTTEVLTFWNIASRFRVGVALPLVDGDGPVTYLRLGLPF